MHEVGEDFDAEKGVPLILLEHFAFEAKTLGAIFRELHESVKDRLLKSRDFQIRPRLGSKGANLCNQERARKGRRTIHTMVGEIGKVRERDLTFDVEDGRSIVMVSVTGADRRERDPFLFGFLRYWFRRKDHSVVRDLAFGNLNHGGSHGRTGDDAGEDLPALFSVDAAQSAACGKS